MSARNADLGTAPAVFKVKSTLQIQCFPLIRPTVLSNEKQDGLISEHYYLSWDHQRIGHISRMALYPRGLISGMHCSRRKHRRSFSCGWFFMELQPAAPRAHLRWALQCSRLPNRPKPSLLLSLSPLRHLLPPPPLIVLPAPPPEGQLFTYNFWRTLSGL